MFVFEANTFKCARDGPAIPSAARRLFVTQKLQIDRSRIQPRNGDYQCVAFNLSRLSEQHRTCAKVVSGRDLSFLSRDIARAVSNPKAPLYKRGISPLFHFRVSLLANCKLLNRQRQNDKQKRPLTSSQQEMPSAISTVLCTVLRRTRLPTCSFAMYKTRLYTKDTKKTAKEPTKHIYHSLPCNRRSFQI